MFASLQELEKSILEDLASFKPSFIQHVLGTEETLDPKIKNSYQNLYNFFLTTPNSYKLLEERSYSLYEDLLKLFILPLKYLKFNSKLENHFEQHFKIKPEGFLSMLDQYPSLKEYFATESTLNLSSGEEGIVKKGPTSALKITRNEKEAKIAYLLSQFSQKIPNLPIPQYYNVCKDQNYYKIEMEKLQEVSALGFKYKAIPNIDFDNIKKMEPLIMYGFDFNLFEKAVRQELFNAFRSNIHIQIFGLEKLLKDLTVNFNFLKKYGIQITDYGFDLIFTSTSSGYITNFHNIMENTKGTYLLIDYSTEVPLKTDVVVPQCDQKLSSQLLKQAKKLL